MVMIRQLQSNLMKNKQFFETYSSTLAILLKNGTKEDMSLMFFPNCTHLFVKTCTPVFILKNINRTIFPHIKHIGVYDINSIKIINNLAIKQKLSIVEYSDINQFYFQYYNNTISIGTLKN